MTLPDHIASPDWFDLSWSDWLPLDPEADALSTLSTNPGLYRVRHPAYDRLVYVGETGRNTRERVRALATGAYADEMPYRDPHTAAPTLWAIRQEHGPELEFSWADPDRVTGKQPRKGIEAALIATHRRDVGMSPVANFGRMIPGYQQSSYSRDAVRGGPLPADETEPNTERGTESLPWTNHDAPLASDWMGLAWADTMPLGDVLGRIPEASGVYRIWDDGTPMEYIGQSSNLKSRIYKHRRNRDGSLHVSFTRLPRADASHKLLEIETELLGAHWLACGAAPSDQF